MRASFIAASFLASVGIAGAAPPTDRARPVHLLSDALLARVRPATRRNAGALVDFRSDVSRASGVLVSVQPAAGGGYRGLVLTAEHVVQDAWQRSKLDTLTLADGTRVHAPKVLSTDRTLDYALVEISMATRPNVQTAKIDRTLPKQGTAAYSLGGHTSLAWYGIAGFVHGTREGLAATQKQLAANLDADTRSISTGHITSEGTRAGESQGGFEGNRMLLSDIASAPGGGGGPVFDSKTHMLIGLTPRGVRGVAATRWHLPEVAGQSPVADVVTHIQDRLKTGKIDEASRALVQSWLAEN